MVSYREAVFCVRCQCGPGSGTSLNLRVSQNSTALFGHGLRCLTIATIVVKKVNQFRTISLTIQPANWLFWTNQHPTPAL